jgi:acetolactate synthase-1/2/3 large subunit
MEKGSTMGINVPVDFGAESFIELLNANHVDYIFMNPGSDTFPIQEAIAKFKVLGKRTPEVVLSLHESMAMAAAHGYFMITGRPQVVLVHVDVGLQNIGGALHNVQRGHIGVVLCAGRAPWLLEESEQGERWEFMWLQERLDQPSVVRDYVKWYYEVHSNKNVHQVVQRAFQVASSEPCGPVYLTLPLEILMEKVEGVTIPDVTRHSRLTTPQAEPELMEQVSEMLLGARNPLILTGDPGRHPASVAPLASLAEALGAPVVTARFRVNFPSSNPMFAGFSPMPFLQDADVILVIDSDVPYSPTQTKPEPGAKIIHIDADPVKPAVPMWNFPADILIQADSRKVIPALNQYVRKNMTSGQRARCQARSGEVSRFHEKMQTSWDRLAKNNAKRKPISPDWLCHCINEAIDDDTTVLIEAVSNTPSVLRQIRRDRPGTFYGNSGTSLGWGLGAALGAKLASPEKTVVTIVADGCFIYGCPIPSLWAASTYRAPFLTVILNNKQYQFPKGVIQKAYGPQSYSAKSDLWIGIDIEPSPDYAMVAEACQTYGRRVEEPSEIPAAVKEALETVRRGQPAVLDVIIEREPDASFFG